jgi:hypothetical protein
LHPIELSILWVVVGVAAFLLWARSKREWPFGEKRVDEQYLHADPKLLEFDEEDVAVPVGGGGGRSNLRP